MIYKSFADLSNTIRKNLWKIPYDIDIIVGIPRSGMIVALILSEFLNKRVTDVDSFIGNIILNTGRRGKFLDKSEIKNVLVIDDTVYKGNAIKSTRKKLSNLNYNIKYACVYAEGKNAKEFVDIYLEDIYNELDQGMYLYEWNIFQHHSDHMKFVMTDMDGVICKDPPNDSDTTKYENYIKDAIPMITPKNTIGTICTYRLEKYREITKDWLHRYNINYYSLLMFPEEDRLSRNSTMPPERFKANIYSLYDSYIFIESSDKQAREIFRLTNKPVLCYSTGVLYK